VAGRRLVDGQSERDDGGDDKNNERDVLQRFPDQLQKGFRRPRWYDVRAKHLLAMPYVVGRTAQTFNVQYSKMPPISQNLAKYT